MVLAIDGRNVKALERGRIWERNGHAHPQTWDSACGNFRIVELDVSNDQYMLIAFQHDASDDGEVWRKRFDSLEEAMEYVEMM